FTFFIVALTDNVMEVTSITKLIPKTINPMFLVLAFEPDNPTIKTIKPAKVPKPERKIEKK
ncbi:MAG: hypothetical protein ACOVLD_01265, partial [Bacteroidia bacterium]